MNLPLVLHVVGLVLLFVAAAMLVPIGVTVLYGDGGLLALGASALITGAAGGLLYGLTSIRAEPGRREAFAIVGLSWLGASLFGAVPFILSGAIPDPTDAVFETISGFTTTGASILERVETLPHGLLFWRSLTQWLGGMGIIVFSVAILPVLGVGGMELLRAELPRPEVDRLRPRIAQTARSLWGVYLVLTVAEILLLLVGGMDLFDATCHTFSTLATGGFSTRTESIAAFPSPMIQYTVILFMGLAGTNFTLHYRALIGQRPTVYWTNGEFKFFVTVLLAAVAVIFLLNLRPEWGRVEPAFRDSLFQVVSVATTTGYSTADFAAWPPLAQLLLVALMFAGGCAGSTGGGMKMFRILTLLKNGLLELRRLLHPHGVFVLKISGRTVREGVIANVMGFFMFYVTLFLLMGLIMAGLGLDPITALASVAATLGNIGPGLGSVGPAENYAMIPTAGKWVLSFAMLLGRLELFALLVLLKPELWRR